MNTTEKLEAILYERGISRRQLANACGIPPTTLQAYMEKKAAVYPSRMIEKIVNTLGVMYEDILDDSIAALQFKTSEEFAKGILLGAVLPRVEDDKQYRTLISDFNKLNTRGRQEAKKRINELTQLPKYTDGDKPSTT